MIRSTLSLTKLMRRSASIYQNQSADASAKFWNRSRLSSNAPSITTWFETSWIITNVNGLPS